MRIGILAIVMTSLGLWTESTYAQSIRVLVSISKPAVSESFTQKIRRNLNRQGFSEADYQILSNADQSDLYKALTATDTRALIWISHGASVKFSWKTRRKLKGTSGMSALPELIDYRGDNVAPIFKAQNPNLKFLAVIGCNSEQILDYVGSEFGNNDGLSTFIPSSKIIGQFAIRKAIRQLSALNESGELKLADESPSLPTPTEFLTLTRSVPTEVLTSKIRSLRIMMDQQLLGVIPSVEPGQSITLQIPLPKGNLGSIRLESGQPIMTDPTQIDFGLIEILTPAGKKMRLFSKNDGTPFGLNFRLFLSP